MLRQSFHRSKGSEANVEFINPFAVQNIYKSHLYFYLMKRPSCFYVLRTSILLASSKKMQG